MANYSHYGYNPDTKEYMGLNVDTQQWEPTGIPPAVAQQAQMPPEGMTTAEEIKKTIPAAGTRTLQTLGNSPGGLYQGAKGILGALGEKTNPNFVESAQSGANALYSHMPGGVQKAVDYLNDPHNTPSGGIADYEAKHGPLYQPQGAGASLVGSAIENSPALATLPFGGGEAAAGGKIPSMLKALVPKMPTAGQAVSKIGTYAGGAAGGAVGGKVGEALDPYLPEGSAPLFEMAGANLGARGLNPTARFIRTPNEAPPSVTTPSKKLSGAGVFQSAGTETGSQGLQNYEGRLSEGNKWGTPKSFQQSSQVPQMTNALLAKGGMPPKPVGSATPTLPDIAKKGVKTAGDKIQNLSMGTDGVSFDPGNPDLLPPFTHGTVNPMPNTDFSMVQKFKNIIKDAADRKGNVDPRVQKYYDDIMGKQDVPPDQRKPGMTAAQYTAARADLSEDVQSDDFSPKAKTALRAMRDAMDDHLDKTLTAQGRQQDAVALREARTQYGAASDIKRVTDSGDARVAKGILPVDRVHKEAFTGSPLHDLAEAGVAKDVGEPLPTKETSFEKHTVQPLAAGAGAILGHSTESAVAPGLFAGGAVNKLLVNPITRALVLGKPGQSYLKNQAWPKGTYGTDATGKEIYTPGVADKSNAATRRMITLLHAKGINFQGDEDQQ